MELLTIIIFVLIILIVMIIVNLAMKLLRPVMFLGFIFLIIFLLTSGTIVKDFFDIKDNVADKTNIVLMENNGHIITGFVESDEYNLLDGDEISAIDGLYRDEELEEIRGGHYKLFIIEADKLKDIESMEINNKKITGERLYHFFTNRVIIDSITYDDLLVDTGIEERGSMESALFAYMYKNELRLSKSPIFFFESYKEGSITVYPESMFFKFAKFMPLRFIYDKINNLKTKVEDKANTAIKGAME